MLFRFNIGGSGADGFEIDRVPQYYMPYWEKVGGDEERVVYRPTPRTLLYHLWLSFLAVFILFCAVFYSGWPWSTAKEVAREEARRETETQKVEFKQQLKPLMDELKGQLSPEKLAELERKQATDQKRRDADLAKLRSQRSVVDRFLWGIYWLFFCWLVWVAVMPIVTFPLKQVTFARSADDELIIRKRRFITRERRWPLWELGLLDYRVEEERASLRMTTYSVGWWWIARIIGEGRGTIEFYLERQKQRPTDLSSPPRSIKSFLKQMQQLTRVEEILVPQEIPGRRRGRFHTRFGTTTIESEQAV